MHVILLILGRIMQQYYFVLRSRLTILRLEDDKILDHDKAMTGQDF